MSGSYWAKRTHGRCLTREAGKMITYIAACCQRGNTPALQHPSPHPRHHARRTDTLHNPQASTCFTRTPCRCYPPLEASTASRPITFVGCRPNEGQLATCGDHVLTWRRLRQNLCDNPRQRSVPSTGDVPMQPVLRRLRRCAHVPHVRERSSSTHQSRRAPPRGRSVPTFMPQASIQRNASRSFKWSSLWHLRHGQRPMSSTSGVGQVACTPQAKGRSRSASEALLSRTRLLQS